MIDYILITDWSLDNNIYKDKGWGNLHYYFRLTDWASSLESHRLFMVFYFRRFRERLNPCSQRMSAKALALLKRSETHFETLIVLYCWFLVWMVQSWSNVVLSSLSAILTLTLLLTLAANTVLLQVQNTQAQLRELWFTCECKLIYKSQNCRFYELWDL